MIASTWKFSAAALLIVLRLMAASDASPGQAAYEKANRFLVEKKLPEASAAVEEALRLVQRFSGPAVVKCGQSTLSRPQTQRDCIRGRLVHTGRGCGEESSAFVDSEEWRTYPHGTVAGLMFG